MSTLVCSEIRCPWWSSLSQNYGCQRYALSRCCHLLEAHKTEFSENEYALYADSPDEQHIKQWKAENDRFCLEDPKYQEDLNFQAQHPDWFEGKSTFKLRAISND